MTSMHGIAVLVFWTCLFLAAYTYCLYPIVLFLVYAATQVTRDWKYLNSRRERRVQAQGSDALPRVSILVPAFNEERYLPNKIANVRNLDYPYDKLHVIFVSDGSTDNTNAILQSIDCA